MSCLVRRLWPFGGGLIIKKYNPGEVLHFQQQNNGNHYSPRTAGEFWKIKKRKISIGDNQIDTVRTRFKENNKTPFFVSRSKVDLFLKCPRCFYFVMKYGFREPGSFPLSLNNLVDACVKNDMDYCRSHDLKIERLCVVGRSFGRRDYCQACLQSTRRVKRGH